MTIELKDLLLFLVSLLTLAITVIGWIVIHNQQKQLMNLQKKLDMEKASQLALYEKKLLASEKILNQQKDGVKEIGVWADEVLKLRNQKIFLFENVKSHVENTDEGEKIFPGPDPKLVKDNDMAMSTLLTPYIMKQDYGYRYALYFSNNDENNARAIEQAIFTFVNCLMPHHNKSDKYAYSDEVIDISHQNYRTITNWVMTIMERHPFA